MIGYAFIFMFLFAAVMWLGDEEEENID